MEAKKRISCRRCQLRKLKCTRVHPCENCVSSSSECSFREDDVRRRPVNRAYVAALEERLASYEATIKSLQQQQQQQQQQPSPSDPPPTSWSTQTSVTLTSAPGTAQAVTPAAAPNLIFDYSGSSRMSTLILQPSPQGHRSFYGPTSIYQKGSATENLNDTGTRPDPPAAQTSLNAYQDLHLSGLFKVDDAILNDSLSMFFRHLAAECPFVDERTLVQDFTGKPGHGGKFWSYPLLYAICALGARISRDGHVAGSGDALGRCVHKLLSMQSLQSPHLTIVQALLCLSLFEFGAGNNTKGWILSGMAFRMVQDMGLHQDPKFLVEDDSSISLREETRMRRKVFWGCYVIDKIISLYFGRPVNLRFDDSAVDPLDPEEEDPTDTEAIPEKAASDSPLFSLLDNSVPSLLMLVHLTDLSKIIETMMAEVFSTRLIKLPRKELVTHRVAKLEELNLRLFQWHSSLPEALAWNQWTPTTRNLPPQLAILHTLYHSCIISLNRHFIRPTPGFARRTQARQLSISSADSIMTITRQYRAQHTLATAPLVLVYSLAMAATAVTFALDSSSSSSNNSSGNGAESGGAGEQQQAAAAAAELGQHMNFLLKTLGECGKTYDVALHISEKLRRGTLRKKNPQTQQQDAAQGSESAEEKAVTADGAQDVKEAGREVSAAVQDWMGPTLPQPQDVPSTAAEELADSTAATVPWWSDDVLGYQPGQDSVDGQLDGLLFADDAEGDMFSHFNWSNMML